MQEQAAASAPPMADLGQWLLENNQKRRTDGVWDCATMPAEWAIHCGYSDPVLKWRGAWADENSALAIIEGAGGLVPLFDDGLFSVGVGRRYGEPELGDIGVIRIMDNEAGAIYTGKRWAFVANRGLAYCSIEPEYIAATWKVL